MVANGFAGFVTVDQHLEFQQDEIAVARGMLEAVVA